MKRIVLALLFLSAAVFAGRWLFSSPPGPVVIYLVDTLRFDRMSAYGAARSTSPAAEALARDGVRYDTAYAVSSWTRPSMASLFTSRWPSEVGAVERGGAIAAGIRTITNAFADAGWRTAGFCGQPNVYVESLGFRRGFQAFTPILSSGNALPTADQVVDPAVRWIASQKDGKFFLYIHVVDPHYPYDHALPGYFNMFPVTSKSTYPDREERLSHYDTMIRQADDQFAKVRQALEEKGFWKPALVIYTADHGEQFYEHGGLYHGDTLYEECVRVPLIIKAPRWHGHGAVIKAPVSLLDLAPSAANWAGIAPDPGWKGMIINRNDPPPGRSLYLTEELDGSSLYAVRRGNEKLIVSVNLPFRVQFDLKKDPEEQQPVPIDQQLLASLERLRRMDVARYGGLTIRKIQNVAMRIGGRVTFAADSDPFLMLPDAERHPINAFEPHAVVLDEKVAIDQPFVLHFGAAGDDSLPEAHLVVESGTTSVSIDSPGPVRPGPLSVERRHSSPLTRDEFDETVARMKDLGYLGGH